jgi:small subunit ribosomal protein S11
MAKTTKRKPKKNVSRGVVHIKASFNNTIVTITDSTGAAVSTGSAGSMGFKGTRKSTPFAAQRASDTAAQAAMRHGMREVDVRVKGAGSGRLKVLSIEDVTPLPHNGCRASKRRRV